MNRKIVESAVVFVAVIVAAKLIVRYVEGPDNLRTLQMRLWRGVKTVADSQSVWWGDVGLRAGTRYNKCRL